MTRTCTFHLSSLRLQGLHRGVNYPKNPENQLCIILLGMLLTQITKPSLPFSCFEICFHFHLNLDFPVFPLLKNPPKLLHSRQSKSRKNSIQILYKGYDKSSNEEVKNMSSANSAVCHKSYANNRDQFIGQFVEIF